MDQVNWVQLGWAILAGLGVGLVVYMIGAFLDRARERRWDRDFHEVRDIVAPEQRDDADKAARTLDRELGRVFRTLGAPRKTKDTDQ